VVSGQQHGAREILLQAESFIAHRGLGKAARSRKVRVLHYIYLYLRVIEESTHMYEELPAPALDTSNMLYPSLRTHNLRLGKDLDAVSGDFETLLFGDDVNGQRDKFAEIYGFPQQLLSFISRATCLANAMAGTTCPRDVSALEQQCRQLEAEICEWKAPEQVASNEDDPFSLLANQIMMPHLIDAMHSAIMIFFYRRVRHVHPVTLQHCVERTVSKLERFEAEKKTLCLANCGIVWPGFMAAAEALDEGLQDRARLLLRSCATETGMRNFDLACDLVENVWRTRRSLGLSVDWGRCLSSTALVLT
jgi:arginine metabolism regulation protein II